MVEESGIGFEKKEGEIAPPLKVEGEEAAPIRPEEVLPKPRGGVPLHPAVAKLTLRAEGLALAQWTGFPLWEHDEATLNDIGDLVQQCEVTMPPLAQVIIAILTLHAAKAIFYFRWIKMGKPQIGKAKEEASG